jgi:hypothetical protein
MAKDCVNHAGAPALAACTRCQKPLCRSCAVVTPTGTFCSPECKFAAREPQSVEEAGGGAAKLLVAIVLLIVAAMCLVHLAVRKRPEGDPWKKIDLLGQLFKRR